MSDWQELIPYANGIAYNVCSRNERYMSYLEDVQQEAVIALWRKSLEYDPAHGTTLAQFARDRIAGAAWDALRSARAVSRNGQPEDVQLDDLPVADPRCDHGRTSERIAAQQLIALCSGVHEGADRGGREALTRRYLHEEPLDDIAASMGVNQSRVSQIVKRAGAIIRGAVA